MYTPHHNYMELLLLYCLLYPVDHTTQMIIKARVTLFVTRLTFFVTF